MSQCHNTITSKLQDCWMLQLRRFLKRMNHKYLSQHRCTRYTETHREKRKISEVTWEQFSFFGKLSRKAQPVFSFSSAQWNFLCNNSGGSDSLVVGEGGEASVASVASDGGGSEGGGGIDMVRVGHWKLEINFYQLPISSMVESRAHDRRVQGSNLPVATLFENFN